MKGLNKRAFGRLLGITIVLGALLFIPAWTIRYWQAWLFLSVFSFSLLALTIYLASKNPQLFERRLNASSKSEMRTRQKILHFFMSKALVVAVVFSAIDHRYNWSVMPTFVVLAGDVMVVLGFLIVMLVFKENAFASATIEIQSEQKTISTGPYALVRHPMYSGWLVTFFGIPLALGSWWGLFIVIPFTVVTILRLLDEETLLTANLPGYLDYAKRVPYRLAPLIW